LECDESHNEVLSISNVLASTKQIPTREGAMPLKLSKMSGH
jgi:hypothetical protein